MFDECGRPIDWDNLVRASSEEEVKKAFENVREDYKRRLRLLLKPEVILSSLRESTFPKRNRAAQIRFLSDSIAADGLVSTRRSRDICSEERNKLARQGQIIRREFFIECTCGYKGPALYGSCLQCGAPETSFFSRTRA